MGEAGWAGLQRIKMRLGMSWSDPDKRTNTRPTFGLDGRLDVQSIPLGIKVGVGFDGPVGACRRRVLRLKHKHTQITHL